MDEQVSLRPIERPGDDAALASLDITYFTGQSFQVVRDAGAVGLTLVDLPGPRSRSLPLDLDADGWTDGWVAVVNGRLVGFVATSLAEWNRRLIIWHFYVDAEARRQGVGRRLMDLALEAGARRQAIVAWLETSNFNVPGVEIYRRLGFELSGFDETIYLGTGNSDEFALFMSRSLQW
jgi:ribosomal protein S18 acetylase RimI-like enzyme